MCVPDCPVTDIQWCSGIDKSTGKSRLFGNYCTEWCNKSPGDCDNSKDAFCRQNPDAKQCACMYPQENKYYQNVIKAARDIGVEIPTSNVVCWLPACEGEDLVNQLQTSEMKKIREACKQAPVNICQQIIDARDAGRDINIDGNDFKLVCNQTLPPAPPKTDCKQDSDCPSQQHCQEGKCVQTISTSVARSRPVRK